MTKTKEDHKPLLHLPLDEGQSVLQVAVGQEQGVLGTKGVAKGVDLGNLSGKLLNVLCN